MFLLKHRGFDVMTFEPNPELWTFYDTIPTCLQKAAAYTYDGYIDLIIDPVDGDGSTIFNEKRVDFSRRIANEDCPVITTPCVDLARVISELSGQYEEIVLKLDVEGAEYDILERLLETGEIDRISKLYCEFHGQKMELAPGRHDAVVKRVEERVELAFWDALPFSFKCSGTDKDNRKRRNALLEELSSRLAQSAV